jgi:cation transport protein ChaC
MTRKHFRTDGEKFIGRDCKCTKIVLLDDPIRKLATGMPPARPNLTPELISRVPPADPASLAPAPPANRRPASDADYAEMVSDALRSIEDRANVHVFAYGSLIWNTGFAHEGEEVVTARGWHRAFRLGWDVWFRGCTERPGLMLVLDRGGTCRGVCYRLPEGRLAGELEALFRREVLFVPHAFPARWITVEGKQRMRALTFAMDRNSGAYVPGMPEDRLAEILALAAGGRGTMAEYLYNTVTHLEQRGIRDRRLWRLQSLVAERLAAMPPRPSAATSSGASTEPDGRAQ